MSPDSPSQASSERLLRDLRSHLHPAGDVHARIRSKMQARMSAPAFLAQAREAIRPDIVRQRSVWARISSAVGAVRPAGLFDRLRDVLVPDSSVQETVWNRMLGRLQPSAVPVLLSRPIKLVAAFAVLILVARLGPQVLFAPPTIADATVSVFPTTGQVSILRNGLWQPLQGELTLQKAATIQTGNDGQATVVFYDNAVVRLAPNTTISINDFSDRPKPAAVTPTFSLQQGDLWVMGLVPSDVEAISVGTNEALVAIHEGSVALHQNATTSIEVWHRSATVERRGHETPLLAGERMDLSKGTDPVVQKMEASAYDQPWVTDNLTYDAVHQHEIAQMQEERQAAAAGILPDSNLYGAKRMMEAVDVLFTFTPEARARKLLSQANTRLDEAAALLARGSGSAAEEPLREYHDTLMAVATGSGTDTAVTSLVAQEVAQASADVSAALPDDSAYALKQTVRDTMAALPDTAPGTPSAAMAGLLDQLSLVKQKAEQGEWQEATTDFEQLQAQMPSADNVSPLSASEQDEVNAMFSSVADAIDANKPTAVAAAPDTSPTLVQRRALELAQGTGTATSASARPARTPAEITDEALQIYNRIVKTYRTPEGQASQLRLEVNRLQGDSDRGSIFRQLYHMFGAGDLRQYVKSQLMQIEAGQQKTDETGTGAVQ